MYKPKRDELKDLADKALAGMGANATDQHRYAFAAIRELIADSEALDAAEKWNDTDEPLEQVMAGISDLMLPFTSDVDSPGSGTILEKVEVAAQMALSNVPIEDVQPLLDALTYYSERPRDFEREQATVALTIWNVNHPKVTSASGSPAAG